MCVAEGPVTLMVHSTKDYGEKNLEKDKADPELVADMLSHVRKVIPWLPQDSEVLQSHKWKYCSVSLAY